MPLNKHQLSDKRKRAGIFLLCELFEFLRENQDSIGAEKCSAFIKGIDESKKDALTHFYAKYNKGSLKL